MANRNPESGFREVVAIGNLWWVILVASAAAIVANVIFYFIVTRGLGEPLLMPEQFPLPEVTPLGVGDVVIFSAIFSLGAGIVFVIVASLSARPIRTFVIISLVVLILSCFLPLRIPTPPVAMSAKLTLVAMHIIGAIVVVGVLVTLGRQRRAT